MSCKEGKPFKERAKTYFADLNPYTHMAHYVAKVLSQTPNSILDAWCVPALIVAYGYYANEESYRNFLDWKGLGEKERSKIKRPEEYRVHFYSAEDMEEGG